MPVTNATVADLATIPDVEHRAHVAGALAQQEQDAADRARRRRDAAAVLALRAGLVRQVDLLEPLGVTRARLKRIVAKYEKRERAHALRDEGRDVAAIAEALDVSEKRARTLLAERVLTFKDPLRVLRETAPQVIEHDEAAEAARRVRNEAAHTLLSTKRPADVARIIGVTTARVSQMGMHPVSVSA